MCGYASITFRVFCFGIYLAVYCAHAQSPGPIKIPDKPVSYLPYRDLPPCYDTLKILWYKRELEVGLAMPAWLPVTGSSEPVVFEGTVIKTPNTTHINTHVSQVDMPLYHYTYDFTFNAVPDSYPDNRFSNVLATLIEERQLMDQQMTTYDTSYQSYLHIEWETGLGASQKGNPCSARNLKGKSCGFFSHGHEAGDTIWNWPAIGDWVHVEGVWVFDRGHPPAETEIHPARFIAIRRNLPEKVELPGQPGVKVWATRVDVFASGDGGALFNNRDDRAPFAHPVKMSSKNYHFEVRPIIPPPSEKALLRYFEVTRKGNTYREPLLLYSGQGKLQVNVRWKGMPDTLVLAKTIYLYWDEGNGKPDNYRIHTYQVTLDALHFENRKEFISRHEMLAYAEVGGRWFFLNELFGKGNPLTRGLGKSYRKNWPLNLSFVIHIPDSTEFRVHAGAWELDGVDRIMGRLFDPYSPCTQETKKQFRKHLNMVSPFRLRGCINDLLGEVHDFYTPEMLGDTLQQLSFSRGEDYDDICICNRDIQNNMMSLRYRIQKVGQE